MQDSQRIRKNVESLLDKYGQYIDADSKLVLLYLREYEQLEFDSRYISTSDFLQIDMNLIQNIINAKYLLTLLEDSE